MDGTSRVTQLIKGQSAYVRKFNQVTLLSPTPILDIDNDRSDNFFRQDVSAGPDVPEAKLLPHLPRWSRKMPRDESWKEKKKVDELCFCCQSFRSCSFIQSFNCFVMMSRTLS